MSSSAAGGRAGVALKDPGAAAGRQVENRKASSNTPTERPVAETPPTLDELRQWAIQYIERDWNVIPVRLDAVEGKKRPTFPTDWQRFQTERITPEIFDELLKLLPTANGLAIITGKISGIWAVDVDGPNNPWPHPQTLEGVPQVQTGGGGAHLYYKDVGLPNTAGKLAAGVDTRGEGGLLFAPPSWHPIAECRYRWVVEVDPLGDLPEPPPALVTALLDGGRKKEAAVGVPRTKGNTQTDVEVLLAGVKVGGRDDAATRLAGHFLGPRGWTPEETVTRLLDWNSRNYEELPDGTHISAPLSKQDIEKVVSSVAKREHSNFFIGKTFIPSRMAEYLLEQHAIDGQHTIGGRVGEDGAVESLWCYTQAGVYHRAKGTLGAEIAQVLRKDSRKSRHDETLFHLAQVVQRVFRFNPPDHHHLINVRNGMLDTRTGQLLPHDPKYLSTTQLPVQFDSGAESGDVDRFFEEDLPHDAQELAEEMLGYCIMPVAKYKAAFVLCGPSDTGKSTFIALVRAFVGEENVVEISLQSLCGEKFAGAELDGKLVGLYDDLPQERIRDLSTFKILSGGPSGYITAERKWGQPFRLFPTAAFVFAANEMPRTQDHSDAVYRRLTIIPFEHIVPQDEQDSGLLARLTTPEALSYLLNRALRGLQRLEARGHFSGPPSTVGALEKYKADNEPVREFVAERCILEPGAFLPRAAFYDEYISFLEVPPDSKKAPSKRWFYRTVERTFPNVKVMSRFYLGTKTRCFVGIRLRRGDEVVTDQETRADQQRQERQLHIDPAKDEVPF